MTRALLGVLLIVSLAAGLVQWLIARQSADPTYVPQVAGRTWTRNGPLVAIDSTHWNAYTAERGYPPFAKLLISDGYLIIGRANVAALDVLDRAKVLVVANALGLRGVIREVAQTAGIHLDALGADAFSTGEAARIEEWVREGGSLLLVADHAPAGRAVQSLAERFEVVMHDGFVADPEHSERGAPTVLVFTREARTLGAHPIIFGTGAADMVKRVVTFTGQALEGPSQAVPLLVFSGTAYETRRRDAGPEDRVPVAGLSQGLALQHGLGRVVVLGEAAVLTSQVLTASGHTERIGLKWPDTDNERFARHIMKWLSRAGE